MKRWQSAFILIFTMPLALFSIVSQADSIERGQAAAAICASCHQADGSGMNIPGAESWPRLSGLNADYLVAQVKAFQEGTRTSPTMLPFASMLNEQQLVDVAAFYASLPAKPVNPPTADAALLKHGEKLANQGDWDRYIVPCASCHGAGNQGNGAEFPAIAGQHPGYISQSLLAWQQGQRTSDPQQLMAAIAKRLSTYDIEAVSAWLATQPAQ